MPVKQVDTKITVTNKVKLNTSVRGAIPEEYCKTSQALVRYVYPKPVVNLYLTPRTSSTHSRSFKMYETVHIVGFRFTADFGYTCFLGHTQVTELSSDLKEK